MTLTRLRARYPLLLFRYWDGAALRKTRAFAPEHTISALSLNLCFATGSGETEADAVHAVEADITRFRDTLTPKQLPGPQ